MSAAMKRKGSMSKHQPLHKKERREHTISLEAEKQTEPEKSNQLGVLVHDLDTLANQIRKLTKKHEAQLKKCTLSAEQEQEASNRFYTELDKLEDKAYDINEELNKMHSDTCAKLRPKLFSNDPAAVALHELYKTFK